MGGKKEFQCLKKENKRLQTQIDSFTKLNVLRKKFTVSGGGLSGNEQIYLDDSQALTILKLPSSKFYMAMENVVKLHSFFQNVNCGSRCEFIRLRIQYGMEISSEIE
ncbi:hypothetical protein ACFFIF_10900 [Vagococcus entomophilus]|uniref:Uncharacterized protein n=2 Tax=Vagococcus entomophilus TaxID=1160095 RepID=A0A430AF20_9ENTE|nr:hypothetical protein [Vagococcus entomophilus]RSU06196.1 hypothetical protein CBF30_10795 [Vagococcus entomophilus]